MLGYDQVAFISLQLNAKQTFTDTEVGPALKKKKKSSVGHGCSNVWTQLLDLIHVNSKLLDLLVVVFQYSIFNRLLAFTSPPPPHKSFCTSVLIYHNLVRADPLLTILYLTFNQLYITFNQLII